LGKLDVGKLVEIYGKDGFFSKTVTNYEKPISEIRLPHWIRNNSK